MGVVARNIRVVGRHTAVYGTVRTWCGRTAGGVTPPPTRCLVWKHLAVLSCHFRCVPAADAAAPDIDVPVVPVADVPVADMPVVPVGEAPY
jgi:hypothetical protein